LVAHQFLSHARRLALPLAATSLSIGASMLVGDVACQYLQFSQAHNKMMEQHTQEVAAATAAGRPAPPMPDIAAATAYTPAPDAPAPRLPSLPASWLSLAPRWWNPTRSMAMLATGALAGAPWQFTLVRVGEHYFPGRSARAIASKMAVNMGTAPIGISSTFFLTSYFQGNPSHVAFNRIEKDMPSTFVTGFVYCTSLVLEQCIWHVADNDGCARWHNTMVSHSTLCVFFFCCSFVFPGPFVSLLNLRFVEVAWRPVVGSLAGSIWNIYISAKANSEAAAAAPIGGTVAAAASGAAATTHSTTIPVKQHAAALVAAATMPAGSVALPSTTKSSA
jgi:hypothetical protein